MFNKNGKRVIQVAIKHIIELPGNISDDEIEKFLEEKYKGKEYQWCDGDQDVFGDREISQIHSLGQICNNFSRKT